MIHIQSTFFCLFHPFYGMLAEKSFQWKCGNGRSARQKVIKCLQICIKRRIKNKKYNRTRNEPKYIWTTPHALFGETATHTWTRKNCSTHAADQKKNKFIYVFPKKNAWRAEHIKISDKELSKKHNNRLWLCCFCFITFTEKTALLSCTALFFVFRCAMACRQTFCPVVRIVHILKNCLSFVFFSFFGHNVDASRSYMREFRSNRWNISRIFFVFSRKCKFRFNNLFTRQRLFFCRFYLLTELGVRHKFVYNVHDILASSLQLQNRRNVFAVPGVSMNVWSREKRIQTCANRVTNGNHKLFTMCIDKYNAF